MANLDLTKYGITGATEIIRNPSYEFLYEEEMKKDLEKKLQEFASSDNMEEVSENREQIEISRFYEKLPKPTLIAAQEYIEGKLYFSNPAKERDRLAD